MALQGALRQGGAELAVEHPHYTFQGTLSEETAAALAEDFEG